MGNDDVGTQILCQFDYIFGLLELFVVEVLTKGDKKCPKMKFGHKNMYKLEKTKRFFKACRSAPHPQ